MSLKNSRKNWKKVADEEFRNMPDNFQDDWADLKEITERS